MPISPCVCFKESRCSRGSSERLSELNKTLMMSSYIVFPSIWLSYASQRASKLCWNKSLFLLSIKPVSAFNTASIRSTESCLFLIKRSMKSITSWTSDNSSFVVVAVTLLPTKTSRGFSILNTANSELLSLKYLSCWK